MNVIKKLKQKAKRQDDQNYKAYKTLRDNGIKAEYPKDTNYRTAFGPFKVKTLTFESRTFYFDPENLFATSYGWWSMLRVINKKIVRNACGYSMQTSVHQNMLDRAMKALGIKADITVHTKANIGSSSWRAYELEQLAKQFDDANRSRKKNRKFNIKYANKALKEFNKLAKQGMFKAVSKKELDIEIKKANERKNKENAFKLDLAKRKKQRQIERENELVEVFVKFGERHDSHGVMTVKEYKEYKLQMSTGDFHMHYTKPVSNKPELKLVNS